MEKKVNKKYYIGFLLVLLLAYLIVLSQSKGDFKVMLDAAELLRNGKNIYNVSLGDNVGLYYYSPLFALLLIPFTYVPYFIPNLLWLLASAFWVYRIWKLIQKDLDLTGFSNKQINQLIILSFLCTIRFILYNFGLIQLTVFMLWAILESLHLFEKNKNIHGSLLLALAINFKLLPIVILPYLFYRKNFQPLFLTLFFMAVYLFLPALFISKTTNSFLLYEWWGAINPAQDGFKFETDWSVHSLNA